MTMPERGRVLGLLGLALASGVLAALLLGAGPSVSQFSPPGSPGLRLTPLTVDFGEVGLDDPPQSRTVTVSSTGDVDLVVGQAEVVGDVADFAVTPDSCRGTSLPPGSSCDLRLEFRPVGEGRRQGRLVVRSNAGAPATVGLTGAGRSIDGAPPPTTSPPVPVPAPTLRARPVPVAPRRTVTATGSGYEGRTELLWDGVPLGSAMPDEEGRITHAFKVPDDVSQGDHLLIACDSAPPCGQLVVVTEPLHDGRGRPVAAIVLAILLLLAVATWLAIRSWQDRGRRRGVGRRGCRFGGPLQVVRAEGRALRATVPLQLDCGDAQRDVVVEMRDAAGRRLVPSGARVLVRGAQGSIEATVERPEAPADAIGDHAPQPPHRPTVALHGPWPPIEVTVRVTSRPTQIAVVVGSGPFSVTQPLDRRRPQASVRGPWGQIVLTATFDPRPQLRAKGRWGPIEVNVTVEPDHVGVAADVVGQPLDLRLRADPRNPAISMRADLGYVDLACEYHRPPESPPGADEEVEVALRSHGTDLDQRRLPVQVPVAPSERT